MVPIRGFVRPQEEEWYMQKRTALPIMKPWQKRIELQPIGMPMMMCGGKHRRMK